MFRVDPAYKREPVLAHVRGDVVEDYQFLQLTQSVPIWIVHIREQYWLRYMFNYLPHALEAMAYQSIKETVLYVLLPEHMTSTGKLTTSLVTRIYECRRGRSKGRRFEISTESGIYRINEWGSTVRKTLREEILVASSKLT